jgi:BirA family biotin operon repressor/biotin-[acetyl-CoA-carboxylase] ligase
LQISDFRLQIKGSEPLPREFKEAVEREQARLGPFGTRIVYFPSIGSTNDVAAALAGGGIGQGAVVVADTQTSGRGRRGRQWFSPPLSGLYVSIVLEPPLAAKMLVTLAAGVGLSEGVQAATGLPTDIKWPNDLLAGSRKLAGILAEAVTRDAVVLGYGINAGLESYPPELKSRATSLERELGRPVDRPSLFVETLVAVAGRYNELVAGRSSAILDAWRERSPGSRGRRVTWETPTGVRSGTTAGIDDEGALLVSVGDRVERLIAGEVVWL